MKYVLPLLCLVAVGAQAEPLCRTKPCFRPGFITFATQAQPLIEVMRTDAQLATLVIFGEGKAAVEIHPDGRVTLHGSQDEAALAFWNAVEKIGLLRCQAPARDRADRTRRVEVRPSIEAVSR